MPPPEIECAICASAPAASIVGALALEALEAYGICEACKGRLEFLCSRFGTDLSRWRWSSLADFPEEAFELPDGAEAVAQAEQLLRRPPEAAG